MPTEPAHIVDSFRSFVLDVTADPGHEALDDGHFLSQAHALDLDLVNYSRLYDMTELGSMMADLNAHLLTHGHAGDLELGRSNRSPFEPAGVLFGNGVREAVEELYADDFELFGDRWDFSRIEAREAAWTPDAFSHAHSIIAMNERISDLVRTARHLRLRNRKLRERNAGLRAKTELRGRRG